MDDDTIKVIGGVMAFFALMGGGGHTGAQPDTHQEHLRTNTHYERVVSTNDDSDYAEDEESLARNFEDAPDQVKWSGDISVRREQGELSRPIEPNHRVNNLIGKDLP